MGNTYELGLGGPGFLEGGGVPNLLGLHAKGGGPAMVPMLKSLHRGPKGEGADLMDPPPPVPRSAIVRSTTTNGVEQKSSPKLTSLGKWYGQ